MIHVIISTLLATQVVIFPSQDLEAVGLRSFFPWEKTVGFAREKPGETPYGSSRSFWKDVGLGFDLRKFGGLAVPSQTVAMDPGNVPGMFDWFARFSFQHGSWIGLQACQSTKMHIAYVVGHTSWTWHNKRQPQVTDRDLKNGKGQLRSWGV